MAQALQISGMSPWKRWYLDLVLIDILKANSKEEEYRLTITEMNIIDVEFKDL